MNMTQTLTIINIFLLLRLITVPLTILRTTFNVSKTDSFSVLHLNSRSINKNFESFKEFSSTINFKFIIVRSSETWVEDTSFSKNSNFQLSGYKVLHQTRKNRKGGGVCVFVRDSHSFKLREDLSTNCDAIQSLSIEISSTKSKNIIRPTNGDMKQCETHFKDIFF